jgi:hypothetical protein
MKIVSPTSRAKSARPPARSLLSGDESTAVPVRGPPSVSLGRGLFEGARARGGLAAAGFVRTFTRSRCAAGGCAGNEADGRAATGATGVTTIGDLAAGGGAVGGGVFVDPDEGDCARLPGAGSGPTPFALEGAGAGSGPWA